MRTKKRPHRQNPLLANLAHLALLDVSDELRQPEDEKDEKDQNPELKREPPECVNGNTVDAIQETRKRKGEAGPEPAPKKKRKALGQTRLASSDMSFANAVFERLAGGYDPQYADAEPSHERDRDERFRLESCFKNAVCTITTNLNIDIKLFTNVFGGQLTDKLPANRLVIKIGNQRYTIITYASGKIILTNFFYLVNNAAVYALFVNLIELLYALGIGSLKKKEAECDEGEAGRPKKEEIEILFLIENCIFSFQVAPLFFDRQFASQSSAPRRNMRIEGLNAFHDFLAARLQSEAYTFVSNAYCKHDDFPSDLIKFAICRRDFSKLADFKSHASRRRNNNNFVQQRLAILVFRNGKMIVTGMQTCEDLETTFKILFAIVDFFFK